MKRLTLKTFVGLVNIAACRKFTIGDVIGADATRIHFIMTVVMTLCFRYILATQFQIIGAREMFPSFDEPDVKATFSVTVAHFPNVTALSNMPVIDTVSRSVDYR